MLSSSYSEHLYVVDGEKIVKKPEEIFNSSKVYLIIDKKLKTFWVWAGARSRLFHRYMAANWAGKLKNRKKFYNYTYEVIKEGTEPYDFAPILYEVKNANEHTYNLEYPGQSREKKSKKTISQQKISSTQRIIKSVTSKNRGLFDSKKQRISRLLSEIKEIHMHVKYSIDHVEQRIREIERIMRE